MISIIIPVYKVEEYLRQCLDSVVNQTYRNLEIILVDDGSPDSCGKICDEYAQKDARFKVVHKENGGVSDARNAGLEIFQGDYLMFVDSDDWVEPNYCEKALTSAVEYKVSCVAFGVSNIVDGKCEFYSKIDKKQIFSSEEIIRRSLMDTFPFEYPVNKIFKREIYQSLRFPKGYLYEDLAITWQAFDKAQKILVIPDCTYNYRRNRVGSTSEISQKPHVVIDRYMVQKQRISHLLEKFPSLKSLVYTKVAIEALLGLSFVKDFAVKKDMNSFLIDNKEIILKANPKYIPFKLYYWGGLARFLYLKLHPFILRDPMKRI